MRASLLAAVCTQLEREGFEFFQCTNTHSCFDIAARRGSELILLKILENIDSFSKEQANDLRNIEFMLAARAFIIGESTKAFTLAEGVVYERYGIPAINELTLLGILQGEFPSVRKFKKALVRIDGEKISEWRKSQKLSLNDLAEKIGISKDTLHRYEHGKVWASEENAKLLEDISDLELRKKINLELRLSKEGTGESALYELGFETIRTAVAPFDVLAKQKEKLIVGKDADKRTLMKRAEIYSHLSEIFDSLSCFLLAESKKDALKGTAVIRREEIKELENARELIKLIKERKK